MGPGEVSSFCPDTEMVVIHNGMMSVRVTIIQENNLWVFRRGGKCTNIFSRGNINASWKRVRGIVGSFVRAGTIINGHGRETQSWATKTTWKVIIEASINCSIIVIST